jgi:hypothetical protein
MDHFFNPLRIGNLPKVLIWLVRLSHINVWYSKVHRAFFRQARGEMYFTHARLGDDKRQGLFINASSSHYDDAPPGLFNKGFDTGCPAQGVRFLAGCQQPVYPEIDQIFQRLAWVLAQVKGPMEGH